jgi:predicted MFS family arabinose efflux permease
LTEHSIDWLGAVLLAGASAPLLLGLVWGSGTYSWSSAHVIGALVAAVVFLLAFLFYERRVPEPILPFDLMRNRVVASSLLCLALVGMAMFGTISYVPLFVQGVIGTSATSSGVVLTPLMLGAVTASFISGQWVSRSGRVRPNAIAGPIVLTAGMLLLWRMNVHTTNGEAARNMVVTGIGLGLMMQVFVLSVQNAVPRSRIGSATAVTQFCRSIGATLGVTLMGVIVNQGLPKGVSAQGVTIHRLHGALRTGLAHALQPAFFAALIVSALVLPIVLFGVRDVRLRHGFEDVVVGDEPSPQPATAAATPPVRAE